MKNLKMILLLLSFVTLAFSHKILLMVDIDSDSTIYIEGGLSTGRIPAGATISVTEKASGRPLWQGAMPDSGNLTLPLPEKPYTVSLNLSEGHSVTQSGPMKKNDIKEIKNENKKEKSDTPEVSHEGSASKIITILLLVAAVLIGFVFGFKRKQ